VVFLEVEETPASLDALTLNPALMIAGNSLQDRNHPPQGGKSVEPVSNRARRFIGSQSAMDLPISHDRIRRPRASQPPLRW
jgi:hypothetical protein